MTVKIKQYDRQIQQLGQTEYPETHALLKVHGVGHLTALTFVLTLGSKERFGRSRDVGCYLGLRPRRSQSGDHDPQLGIAHAGNAYLRSLLIEGSNHILRPHGRDSALRQWGLHLAARGGKQAKSKAVVAVAASWPCYSITSGALKSRTCRSTNKRPERSTCLPVATTPCSDDCVSVLAFRGRPINGSIDSPLEPQPAPSLHQDSSYRVRIETRWRATNKPLTPVTCS